MPGQSLGVFSGAIYLTENTPDNDGIPGERLLGDRRAVACPPVPVSLTRQKG
jgi:hypothetical protein